MHTHSSISKHEPKDLDSCFYYFKYVIPKSLQVGDFSQWVDTHFVRKVEQK